jgi:hypothetical protein
MSKKNRGKKKKRLGAGKWDALKRSMDYFHLTGKRKQKQLKR